MSVTKLTVTFTESGDIALLDKDGGSRYCVTALDHVLTVSRTDGNVLGTIEHHRSGPDIIQFLNTSAVEEDDFLRHVTKYGNARLFTAPDGKGYKWHITNSDHIELHQSSTESRNSTRLAEYRPPRSHVLRKDQPGVLTIQPAAIPIQDAIVFTWALMERQRVARDAIMARDNAQAALTNAGNPFVAVSGVGVLTGHTQGSVPTGVTGGFPK